VGVIANATAAALAPVPQVHFHCGPYVKRLRTVRNLPVPPEEVAKLKAFAMHKQKHSPHVQ
jgi:hypothetical protein